MGFKLVRVDATEPNKVLLPVGSHLIGRGKFLDCDDHRVSRKHAELVVSSDSVLLKSLHQNPCFIKDKLSKETIILNQTNSHILKNGDQFGLIPDSCWYEVIEYTAPASPTSNIESDNGSVANNVNNDDQVSNETDTQFYNNSEPKNNDSVSDCAEDDILDSPSLLPPENLKSPTYSDNEERSLTIELAEQHIESAEHNKSTDQSNESVHEHDKSLKQSNESIDPNNESTDLPIEPVNESNESTAEGTNKRSHSPETVPCDVKKVKTEPKIDIDTELDDSSSVLKDQPVKTEPDSPEDVKPGPSNNQGGSSNDGNVNSPAKPQSPAKSPDRPLRERCIYGANCYRKNTEHKARFSHPPDADWGAGPRGRCPWGARCRRREPRHWAAHDHPAGAAPPPPRPPGRRRRRQRSPTTESDSGDDTATLIVTGKRARKTIVRQGWSDSEDEDPYKTDESDDWKPPSDIASQDFSQSQD